MKEDNSVVDLMRHAEGKDYESLCPEEPACKRNTFCHVLGGMLVAAVVVIGFTLMVGEW